MPTSEQLQQQERREEELLAAQLAASINSQLREINSMSVGRTPISKAKPLDPRSFIRTAPGVPARTRSGQLQQPQQEGDPLAPRIATIPLPKGVNPQDIIPPEMIKQQPAAQPLPQAAEPWPNTPTENISPTSAPGDAQLELTFRQTNIDDIFRHLETLNSKVDIVLSILRKLETNANISTSRGSVEFSADAKSATTSPVSADKKKSLL